MTSIREVLYGQVRDSVFGREAMLSDLQSVVRMAVRAECADLVEHRELGERILARLGIDRRPPA